jgi:hypothetical protein
MEKQDITMYSDLELSLLVFNTESLYLQRHDNQFNDTVNEYFTFTPEQLAVLVDDIQDDLIEMSEEC